MKGNMILGENLSYSLNCYETRLNNNVMVVGAPGTGKTRSIVTPNLLQAEGSYVVSDPKGNLYDQYGPYLKQRGYHILKLDFTDPVRSAHYNFFHYIRSTQDIVKIAHMLIYQYKGVRTFDPFWDEASQLLIQAMIAFLIERENMKEATLHNILKLLDNCEINENSPESRNTLDRIMDLHADDHKDSYAVSMYRKFRVAAGRTLKSILISVNSRLALFDTPEISEMTAYDDIDIASMGQRKTALFVVVSDTDRSMDSLANLFFTQTMNELCRFADKECEDCTLPVPVRFILDDFATNCTINDFPRMISSIRSRGISTMLMIQAESQLRECYGEDGRTIIGNCDTYVYLGGNDVETAKMVSARSNMPLCRILEMPIGTNWVFRRGSKPVNGKNFNLEAYLKELKLRRAGNEVR